jgi:very-short-patch-repair endonuclease
VTRRQLLELGLHPQAISHRLERGRLHATRWRAVYAVGRPQLTRRGKLMAAVLAGGPGAVLSHRSAAELWGMWESTASGIEISVPAGRRPRCAGITAHRRARLSAQDVTSHAGIPVTIPIQTLIDLATCLSQHEVEEAINGADKLGLTDPEVLRKAVGERFGERGTAMLRELLDRRTFVLTESRLERLFLPIARHAGLPAPLTQQWVNGYRVDFYWPDLGLVVETDGLRYHRTPQQQSADRRRDQAHTASGLTALRFSHAQVSYEPGHVEGVLSSTARRLP